MNEGVAAAAAPLHPRRAPGVALLRIAAYAAGALTAVVVARLLGPRERGIWAVALMIGSMAALASELGVGGALLFFDREGGRRSVTIVSSGLTLVLVSTSVAASGVGLAMFFGGQAFLGSVPLVAVALALAAAIPVNIGAVARQALLSRGDLLGVAGALALQSFAVLGLVGGVLVLIAGGATPALLAYAVAQVLVAALVVARLRRLTPLISPRGTEARGLLAYGVQMHVGTVALFLAYRFDILLVNHFLGPAQAGVYSIALTLSEFVRAIPELGQMSVYSSSSGRHLPDVGPTVRMTVLGTLLVGSAVGFLAFWFVPAVFGAGFAPASVAFLALVPGLLGLAVSYTISPLLVLRGRMRDTSLSAALSLLLMVSIDVLVIPGLGIVGAAAASSAAYLLLAAVQWHTIRRHQSFPVREVLPGRRDAAALFALATLWRSRS